MEYSSVLLLSIARFQVHLTARYQVMILSWWLFVLLASHWVRLLASMWLSSCGLISRHWCLSAPKRTLMRPLIASCRSLSLQTSQKYIIPTQHPPKHWLQSWKTWAFNLEPSLTLTSSMQLLSTLLLLFGTTASTNRISILLIDS